MSRQTANSPAAAAAPAGIVGEEQEDAVRHERMAVGSRLNFRLVCRKQTSPAPGGCRRWIGDGGM